MEEEEEKKKKPGPFFFACEFGEAFACVHLKSLRGKRWGKKKIKKNEKRYLVR
jgi:hypothetical protein